MIQSIGNMLEIKSNFFYEFKCKQLLLTIGKQNSAILQKNHIIRKWDVRMIKSIKG